MIVENKIVIIIIIIITYYALGVKITFRPLASTAMLRSGARAPPLELAHGSFYLRITQVGSGRLLVNTTHFPVAATDSQSLKLA